MAVRAVSSEIEFEQLREGWNELWRSNPNHTPYQSWEWNYAWWKHFGRPGNLYLVLVEHEGRLTGLAPFYISSSYRGVPVRHLSFISSRRADYLDFLIARGSEASVLGELFEFLGRSSWRLIELRDYPSGSSNLPHLLRVATGAYTHLSLQQAEQCATAPLPASWEEYLASLGKNQRRNVGRYRRMLSEKFTVTFKAPTSPAELRQCFEDFATVFRSRWRTGHGATLFGDPRGFAFEREVCELGSDAGWFRFYMLYLDDKPVAGYLGYLWNERFYAGLLAYRPEYHRLSAGSVLIGMSIEDCIGKGLVEFDMTRGAEGYKAHWNCVPKYNYIIKMSRSEKLLAGLAMFDRVRNGLGRIQLMRRVRDWAQGHSGGELRSDDSPPDSKTKP